MYRINKASNNITKLEEREFKELGFKERENLQEWIAKNPDVLGEELLIIQKEYAGFNDTKERLDLLALDKEGGLVIIENKLDDTGRDVVWQALKYTSYCSTLTTEQIIKIFQEYLDKSAEKDSAKELILEFLDREDDDDLLLNSNDQRIVFVANHYRKEVTSTALWLLDHDIALQCFRATPYTFGDEQFLQIEQIIPLPETTEYMIDAKVKEKEKKVKSKKVSESRNILIEFWGVLKERLNEKNLDYLDKTTPKGQYHFGFWKSRGFFAFCVGKNAFRVELYLRNDVDKKGIDTIYKYKDELDSILPGIEWERLENRRASRIKLETTKEELVNGKWRDKENWDDVVEWYCANMEAFYNAILPIWERVQKDIEYK